MAELNMNKQQIIKEHYRKIGRKGGINRAKVLTPERRKEIAIKAGIASGQSRKKLE